MIAAPGQPDRSACPPPVFSVACGAAWTVPGTRSTCARPVRRNCRGRLPCPMGPGTSWWHRSFTTPPSTTAYAHSSSTVKRPSGGCSACSWRRSGAGTTCPCPISCCPCPCTRPATSSAASTRRRSSGGTRPAHSACHSGRGCSIAGAPPPSRATCGAQRARETCAARSACRLAPRSRAAASPSSMTCSRPAAPPARPRRCCARQAPPASNCGSRRAPRRHQLR